MSAGNTVFMQKKKSLHLNVNVTVQPGCQCLVKGISLHVKTARAAISALISFTVMHLQLLKV